MLKTKALFNYYRKNDKIDLFKEKHEDKYTLLIESGFIKD